MIGGTRGAARFRGAGLLPDGYRHEMPLSAAPCSPSSARRWSWSCRSSVVPTRPTTSPPLDVEVYPVDIGDPATAAHVLRRRRRLVVRCPTGALRCTVFDPAAGPLTGFLPTAIGFSMSRQLADGIFWSVVVLTRTCVPCAAAPPEEDPDRPYVLRGIDVATGSPAGLRAARVVRAVALVDTGQQPLRRRSRGIGVDHACPVPYDPATGSSAETLRVDGSTGAIAAVDPHAAPLVVAADDRGVWGAGIAPGVADGCERLRLLRRNPARAR